MPCFCARHFAFSTDGLSFKNRNLGEKHFSSKIYFGAFVGVFSDSPFPNIMSVVELRGMLHCGIGLGVWWNAGNYGQMDSLVRLALDGWFGEWREVGGWIGGGRLR
jgi:hypothetical protein